MADWKVFYKILGVKQSIFEPNAQELLGIEKSDFDKSDILEALNKCKAKLRANLPSDNLQHELAIFEKQVLEEAATDLINIAEMRKDFINKDEEHKEASKLTFTEDKLELKSIEEHNENEDSASELLADYFKETPEESYNLNSDSRDDIDIDKLLNQNAMQDGISLGKTFTRYLLVLFAILIVIAIVISVTEITKQFDSWQKRLSKFTEEPIYTVSPEDDIFQTDVIPEQELKFTPDIDTESAKVQKSLQKRARHTEAEYSKLNKTESSDINESLNKTLSAALSSCDRVAKIFNKKPGFTKQIKAFDLKRTINKEGISISLANLTVEMKESANLENTKKLRHMLFNGTREEKYCAINELARIRSDNSKAILLEKLQRETTGIETRATLNRLIDGLCSWNSKDVYIQLANTISDCPRTILASTISLKLSEKLENNPSSRSILPLDNDLEQRLNNSQWWSEKISRMHDSYFETKIPESASEASEKSDIVYQPEVSKLAAISIFMVTMDNLLKSSGWQDEQNMELEMIDEPKITVAEMGNAFANTTESIFSECARLALELSYNHETSIKIEIIDKERLARLLNCETDLQEAVVNLASTTDIIEYINGELNTDGSYRLAIQDLDNKRVLSSSLPENSIEQLQNEYYFLLRWLDLTWQQLEDKKNKTAAEGE